MAKSHWQGRPAENINVSSRSKTSVMGGRFGDSPGILDARAACVKVAYSGAGRQATNDERRCFLLRGRAYQRRMQEASAALTPLCIGRRLHRGQRMRGPWWRWQTQGWTPCVCHSHFSDFTHLVQFEIWICFVVLLNCFLVLKRATNFKLKVQKKLCRLETTLSQPRWWWFPQRISVCKLQCSTITNV